MSKLPPAGTPILPALAATLAGAVTLAIGKRLRRRQPHTDRHWGLEVGSRSEHCYQPIPRVVLLAAPVGSSALGGLGEVDKRLREALRSDVLVLRDAGAECGFPLCAVRWVSQCGFTTSGTLMSPF